ncbi:2-succinyl-6-hydroxy-2,4-cyclohexadiene-1-carboxylate synthase [Paraconexibacter sp. AEG42_29]|uniref:2-succinyl-6-hydroxy-2, 4-cyclohexadiene-1-carboxylate synthase n=1 Tax=Paraconexibacter sp. AEG42_29 TaxID=2997339 RepID=A0AAU7B201_9ACTN
MTVSDEALGDLTGFRGGSGEPLVLLHGFMGTWRVWRPLLDDLTAQHTVFAPTLPGHHGAAALDPGFVGSIDGMLDVLEAQLDNEGIERAHIVGNSLGGWLSLELGRRGRALSVTALSPAGGWNRPRDRDRVIRLMKTARLANARGGRFLTPKRLQSPRVRKLALWSVAVHGDRVPPQDVAAMLEESLGCAVFDSFLTWVGGRESFPAAAQADYPIRVAWSEKDRTIPFKKYGRPLLASVPGADLVTLPDVGHVPMFDDPALVTKTILEVTQRAE